MNNCENKRRQSNHTDDECRAVAAAYRKDANKEQKRNDPEVSQRYKAVKTSPLSHHIKTFTRRNSNCGLVIVYNSPQPQKRCFSELNDQNTI